MKGKQRTKGLAQRQAVDSQANGQQQVKRAQYESTRKKTVGVDDLCLLSKISNESINDNLRIRFENREIYVKLSKHLQH